MERVLLKLVITAIFLSGTNADLNQCERINVPLCKGLVGYTHTKLPNRFGHTTQKEVYRAIERFWTYIDTGCSENLRLTVCGLYLPKCTEDSNSPQRPCAETCFRARRFCRKEFKKKKRRYPSRQLRCRGLRRKRQGQCIRPATNPPVNATISQQSGICQSNTLPRCHNMTFDLGTLPNYFGQSNTTILDIEMSFYDPIIQSNCHPDTQFLICGTYRPFCVYGNPWALPCRQLCENVKQQCQSAYEAEYGNLPWPMKLQCHLFPRASPSSQRTMCVAPGDDVLSLDPL